MIKKNECLLCKFEDYKVIKAINEYNFKECRQCGLIYIDPQPDEETIKKLYPEKYFHSQHPQGYHDIIARKDDVINYRLKAIMDLINNLSPNKGRLLEVGCALGYFLKLAQNTGWEAQGVELSPWAAQYAREKTNVKVLTGKLEDVNFQDAYFDAIVMIELIEHTQAPDVFLKEVYRILKPDGIILITTPNSKSIHGKIWSRKFQEIFLILEHLFLFSIPTIKRILELTNFKLIHLQTKTYLRRYYDYKIPPGVFRQIRALCRKVMLNAINSLNLGEMLVVIAKKDLS
jgi:2-polyprenyl-3-methyl-5-hydroxy-6-metoxy-1,4-benzoquinol methylase